MLPEMRGRSLEEIDELFEKNISVKEFAKYECECSRQAHEIVAGGKQVDEPVVTHDEVVGGDKERQ
jgi:hypothetical protein